jgi:hypothetical protein
MTTVTTAPCCYCDESLTFRRKLASEDQGPGQGDTSAAWRHPDGSIYKQRAVVRDGVIDHLVDDHCATPKRSAR